MIAKDIPVATLVASAARGDSSAWNSLVDRFAPLVWSICMRYKLSRTDAADVCQNVWLRLTEKLDTIRDPAALAGWLATTTGRECLALLRRRDREVLSAMETEFADDVDRTDPDRAVLRIEREQALLAAFAELPDNARLLLRLLMEDPPRPYREISATLGIPVGSIGPTRARYLERLRRSPALAGFAPTVVGGDSR
jgi:RNA polymerase sigma factor (sigma-70 family)